MKTPMEAAESATQEHAAAPLVQKSTESKPLERLKLFESQRGFSSAPPPVDADNAADVLPAKAAEKKGAKRKGEAAAVPPAGDAVPAPAEIAQLYADAAAQMQSESPEIARAGIGIPGAPDDTAAPEQLLVPMWRSIGPTLIPNGQTYGSARIPVSGRLAAVAIDPSNRDHILAGSAGGGVWESKDQGATWSPRTDTMPTLTTGAIAFDPNAPANVYVGTGEGNFYWTLGAGVLKSTNGGTSWSVVAGAPFMGQGFYDLIVDKANSKHLLAATTGGAYESANAGVAWTLRKGGVCWDLAMAPAGGPASEVLATFSDGLYRSANGGQTYAKVALPGAPATWNRLAVSISPSNPAVAMAFGASGGSSFVYRRNAAGTWSAIAGPTLNAGQAWYDWFISIAPDTDARVYVGAIEVLRGDLSGSTWSWTVISAKSTGDSIHPDQHCIGFDPVDPNVIYCGNDGGLFRSPNRGVNWTHLNNGLGITEIEYLAQDYGISRWLIGGTQDNGSIRYTGPSVWEHVADGDGGDCAVNRGNPNTVFHTFYNMGMQRSTTKGNFGSWTSIGPNVPANYSNLFYPPVENNGDVIAMAGKSVFVSRNNGSNWTEVALPAGCVASAMYIPTADKVFVGCTNGRIFRLDWAGAAWSAANELATPRVGAYVSDLYVNPGNLNRIWSTSSKIGGGRVFRSDDGGTSWTDKSAGLPVLPINAVEVDNANQNRVWVAADLGVFQSTDGGGTWGAMSFGLPNVLVADLLFHPHARVLRAGTRNRGVWEFPVDGWMTTPICGTQFTGTLPANGQNQWFTFNWPATWHVIWTVMPTNPKPGARQVGWTVRVERATAEYATYWINVRNLTNAPLTFEGRYCILSKY